MLDLGLIRNQCKFVVSSQRSEPQACRINKGSFYTVSLVNREAETQNKPSMMPVSNQYYLQKAVFRRNYEMMS